MNIRSETLIVPSSSSDYTFCVSSMDQDPVQMVAAVFDTIGDVAVQEIRSYMINLEKEAVAHVRNNALDNCQALMDCMVEGLERDHESIQALKPQFENRLVGAGMALLSVSGSQGVVNWLGDCRAYHYSKAPDEKKGRFRLMTKDHNRLSMVFDEHEQYTFFQNEFSELSRTLMQYWGSPTVESVRSEFQASRTEVEVQEGDVFLLTTDGIYLPLIRSVMDHTGHRLIREQFNLEQWLNEFIDRKHITLPDQLGDFVRALHEYVDGYVSRKKRYRDDMAMTAIAFEPVV